MILEEERYDPSGEILLALEELRAAIERIQINDLPAPIVHVESPDLNEVIAAAVNAVNELKPGVGAEEIAEVITTRLNIPQSGPDISEVLPKLLDALNNLDFRLKGLGGGGGGGATLNTENLSVSSDVSDRPARELGRVTGSVAITNADLAQEVTLREVRDYLDTVETKLQSLIDKDFATQATLATRASETTLSSLNSKDFATQATLAQVRDNTSTLAAHSSAFARLLKFEPSAGEEVRRDEQANDDYHGAAADGTAVEDPVWRVVRFYKSAGKITRVRYRTGVRWDLRDQGW